MYYISEETFEMLDEGLQKQVLQDTKEHEAEEDMGEEMKSDSDKEMEGLEKIEGDGDQMTKNHPKPEYSNKVKSFDDADEKSMAVMIGFGKPKKKIMKKAPTENLDDDAA